VRALNTWKEPGGSESVHIPSHVYVQLGMWDEAEQVNGRAFDISMAWTTQHGLGLADLNMHNYEHLLRWRQYALLQLGRAAEARALIDRAASDFRAGSKAAPVGTALYRLRAQFMIETGQWGLAADLARDARADNFLTNPFVLQAVGLGAAKSGQTELAREVASRLQSQSDWRSQAEFHQVMGLLELAANRQEAGLKHLAESVAIDEQNIASHGLGVPEPSKPVWELYGEALLDANRPKEALLQFTRALQIYRGRPASLLGAARASRQLGDREAADQYETQLRKIWHRADAR
jgi:tetratricopeptide (TPR) repeat protein